MATDPIQMLTEDHRRVEQLFAEFQQAPDSTEKKRIADQVFQELMVHSKLEKDIFYPAVKSAGQPKDQQLVEHSYHDHAQAEELINRLRGMGDVNPEFESAFMQLQSAVMEHAKEEEDQMFPDAKQQMGDQLPQLGEQMEQQRMQLMTQGQMAS